MDRNNARKDQVLASLVPRRNPIAVIGQTSDKHQWMDSLSRDAKDQQGKSKEEGGKKLHG